MKPRPQSTYLFVTLLTCIMMVVVAMVAAVLVSGQRSVVVVMPPHPAPAATTTVAAASLPAAPAAAVAPTSSSPAPAAPQVTVARVSAAPAIDDPFDARWEQAPAVDLPLQPQQTAAPMLNVPTVTTLRVQALRDDRRIVWRISWAQAEPSHHVNVGRFSDAVAIQFPMVDGAAFTMGGPGMPVRVLYWRAGWQMDVDAGFQEVHHQHPNAWTDMYWFATGEPPYALAEAFKDERSHEWLVAYSAGNPMADFERDWPIEELVAEGFGTLTHVPDSPSHARGVWRDGRWTVVIDRPWDAADPLVERFASTDQNTIAFALWDGSADNVGGAKHYCPWVPLQIKP